jgi:nucleotide-binding universal stress UspA family protein
MAVHLQAELLLVHVIESMPQMSGTFSMSGARVVQMMEAMQQESRNQMEKLVTSSVPADLHCDARIVQGRPAEEIVRLAADEHVDVIVIATHGYSGFNRFLFGSVADRVVRTAQCPVLTIRPPEEVNP